MLDLTTKLVSGNSAVAGETLCFDKNEFMKVNFSVDEFLHKNRHAPSLEQLRDNLGLYLKGLRASMIDLINEDYADFVNLSANLVGLDQSIETIQKPLNQFRTEIESIESLIRENETEMRLQLEKKRELQTLRRNMQSLKTVYAAIKKLEELLSNQLSEKLRPVDLERAALELIQLKFNEKFCSTYLTEEQKQKIYKLEQCVHEKLRLLFTTSLKEASANCTDQLERCLRIYITLDACDIAEKVFRDDVVAPYMNTTISEHSLQNSPQGLGGIYSKVLNFISLHMTDLLRLTQYTDRLVGFNFLVNSFWTDVEMRLETHMPSIFAPGNSDVFYAKYKCTREFLTKIEELLSDKQAIRQFRQHKQLKSFHTRWNLPVYFQICFQEIAGEFEGTLEPLLQDDLVKLTNNQPSSKYCLNAFNSADKAIKRCWSDGVYLSEVFPKFFKLNVQIITRLSHWISEVLGALNSPNNSPLISGTFQKCQLLVVVHRDIQSFIENLLKIEELVLGRLPQNQKDAPLVTRTIGNSFGDLREMLSLHLNTIQNLLIELLISESTGENLRQVNDLPRLYRKTNREVSRCSAYVEQMLRPLKNFAGTHGANLGTKIVEKILSQVVSRITNEYYTVIADVLTSVQKTEESLRRLRNLKSNSSTMLSSMTSSTSNAMSDDQKIRLQLRVDVITWTEELAKMNFSPTEVMRLTELNSMVEESVKCKELNLTTS